jgi:SAM-dependent methyltransferase
MIDRCPACAAQANHLLDWEFSGLGNSVFNYTGRFHACGGCGLVFIGNVDDDELARFYVEECSYFEKPHFSVVSPANQQKYDFYSRFLRDRGVDNVAMADVGCGRGGFVNWLAASGWQDDCCGIDLDIRSLPVDAGSGKVTFREGGCRNLPFADRSRGLLTYFHVLEHIHDLDGLLAEAARVLSDDGHVLIEVPDAENYAGTPIGSAFWFSIREHINHFTASALAAALRRRAFTTLAVSRQMLSTPEFAYPSLVVLARKGGDLSAPALAPSEDIAAFARASRDALMRQARQIGALAADRPITFWGCSAELFSLLPLIDMSRIRLCDASRLKQRASYKGLPILPPSEVPVEGLLVVAPYLHVAAITKSAREFGWPDDAIYVLK